MLLPVGPEYLVLHKQQPDDPSQITHSQRDPQALKIPDNTYNNHCYSVTLLNTEWGVNK